MGPLELWAGVECTVNRVGDVYFDQVRRSGHHERVDDIARFASLGVRAMRYPVLWERVAPEGLSSPSWQWTDERFDLLRSHAVRPIATLLHHGSGPRYTNLLDPQFAPSFAQYAALVASRYPWVTDFTPINEPLTTARFSALYGHWYPHRRDDRAFVRALLNQIHATTLAMERIREFTPTARLISTEDAGRMTCTPGLEYQAEFENHRRWLTLDFLHGLVDCSHPLWNWLIGCGASSDELRWLRRHHCEPAIAGLNYYLTSDRHLDSRTDRYPGLADDGNGRDRYVDADAVRVDDADGPNHQRVLEDAWARYRRPVALTEVHAGCTREEQIRWLARAWHGAEIARGNGADVVAVTTWALLGAYDWNTLVTRADGVYEPGAFDARSDPPRLTAVGRSAKALATGHALDAIAEQQGWWERDGTAQRRPGLPRPLLQPERSTRPILIVGASGLLGSEIARACASRGLSAVAMDRRELDATDAAVVSRAMFKLHPWAVIDAVGDARVDDAEDNPAMCWLLNTKAAEVLAAAATTFHARFLSFSTDLVFDGGSARPYVEDDAARPCNVYGLAKLRAETGIAERCPDALIVRTSPLFSPVDPNGFLTRVLRELSAGRQVATAADLVMSPTYVPHLVDCALDLLVDAEQGIWHLANRAAVSWFEFAALAARAAGLDDGLVLAAPSSRLGLRAVRPRFSALDSSRGRLMPTLDQALADYFAVSSSIWRERRQRVRQA